MSDENITEKLGKVMNAALTDWDIPEVSSLGFSDPETPDPEYIGYAMYLLSGPNTSDYQTIFPMGEVLRRPTKREIAMIVDVEDFFGLMRMSRLSIGQMLVHSHYLGYESYHGPLPNDLFWLHYTNSLFTMSSASDRLRTFFVRGVLKGNPKKWSSRDNKPYAAPFKNLCENVSGLNAAHQPDADQLKLLADQIQALRIIRNQVVHEISTTWASRILRGLRHLQDEFDKRQKFDGGQPMEMGDGPSEMSAQPLEIGDPLARIRTVADGYKALLEAGNLAFKLEHHLRL